MEGKQEVVGISGAPGKMGILAPVAAVPRSPTEQRRQVERKGPGP